MTPDIRVYPTLGSTNDEAARLAAGGETGPLWVLALEQTAGRGRRGRSWVGAPGNLFMTGLFSLPMAPQEAAGISFVAALALADTLDTWVDPGRVRLKWPNDAEIDGAKCSGILIESVEASHGLTRLLVGVGVNLVTAPEVEGRDVASVGASVSPERAEAAPKLVPFAVADLLARHFETRLERWRTGGFGTIRSDWLARARGLGEPITVNLPDRTLHGRFGTLSETGALVLELENGGREHILAGDVFFGNRS